MTERLLNNIEKTIGHVSRQIRRSKDVDSKTVVALARLIRSYSSFLERTEEKEWDYEMNGDPFIHANYEERENERRGLLKHEREAAEQLGIDPDSLEDQEEDEDEQDEDD